MEKEKRLIDAEELNLAVRDDVYIDGRNYARVKKHIDAAETVDAVEVVHGEWKVSIDSEISRSVYCSACGKCFYYAKKGALNIDKMPYCPNCGAKMDLKGE